MSSSQSASFVSPKGLIRKASANIISWLDNGGFVRTLDIEGCIVVADALNCKRDTAVLIFEPVYHLYLVYCFSVAILPQTILQIKPDKISTLVFCSDKNHCWYTEAIPAMINST